MSRRSDRLAARTARRDRRHLGGFVVYRHITRLSGPDPEANPPRYADLVVNGNAAQGATTVGVRGAPLLGRFIAGDILRIGVAIATVAGDAVATNNQASITLTAALPAALADGTAVVPTWLNERTVPAEIQGLGQRIPDGTLIEQRDLFLSIAARNLPWEPVSGDTVTLPTGDVRTVVQFTPLLRDGFPIRYQIQVR